MLKDAPGGASVETRGKLKMSKSSRQSLRTAGLEERTKKRIRNEKSARREGTVRHANEVPSLPSEWRRRLAEVGPSIDTGIYKTGIRDTKCADEHDEDEAERERTPRVWSSRRATGTRLNPSLKHKTSETISVKSLTVIVWELRAMCEGRRHVGWLKPRPTPTPPGSGGGWAPEP